MKIIKKKTNYVSLIHQNIRRTGDDMLMNLLISKRKTVNSGVKKMEGVNNDNNDNNNNDNMVPQSWIINCLKMYKISHEFINFTKKTMKTLSVELTVGGSSKDPKRYFQDVLSPLLFIIVMMPLNHLLRKCTARYKLSRSQEKIYHLMTSLNDIRLFAKNEK